VDPRLKPAHFIPRYTNDMSDERPADEKSMLDIIDGVEDIDTKRNGDERRRGECGGDALDALFYGGHLRELYRALSASTKEQLERRDASGKCIFPSSYIFLSLCLSSNAKTT